MEQPNQQSHPADPPSQSLHLFMDETQAPHSPGDMFQAGHLPDVVGSRSGLGSPRIEMSQKSYVLTFG